MKFDAKIISVNGISAIVGGKPYNVGSDHANYDKILKSLKGKDATEFLKLVTLNKVEVTSAGFVSSESIVVGQYEITYKGEPLHNTVTHRLIELQEEGHDVAPLAKFLEKLMENPSSWCVEALYKFLEAKGLPLTEDGNFLAYKVVNKEWKDKYSNKVLNTIGSIHEVPRNTIDDDRTKECSYGFHVGDLQYSGPHGSYYSGPANDRIIIVKVNPKDVVAVPEKANAHKIRVAKYEVMSEYTEELPNTFVNLSLKDVKVGDKIEFDVFLNAGCLSKEEHIYNLKRTKVILKYEGISKRSKNTKFYGRLLKGTEYGVPGHSASFLISVIYDLRKI